MQPLLSASGPPCPAASVRAVFHRLPIARPFAPPAKGQPAAMAYLGRQICFLAHFRHCALPPGWSLSS